MTVSEGDLVVALLGAFLVFTAVITLFWDRTQDEPETASAAVEGNTTTN